MMKTTANSEAMDARCGNGGIERGSYSSPYVLEKTIANSGSVDATTLNRGMEGGVEIIVYERTRDLYLGLYEKISAMEEGTKVIVKPFRPLEGVFIAKGEEVEHYVLCTKNMVPGEAVYNEKIISAENEDGTNVEYRVWSPFCSTLAAAVIMGVEDIYIKPGARVLYLGAGTEPTTVSHVSDIVGPDGLVYAVESSVTSVWDLVNMAAKRPNVIPIFQDAKFPEKYAMLVGMVDVMCADIVDPDRARIVAENARYCLKEGGHFLMSIKACWEQDFYLWTVLEESDFCTFGYYKG